MGDYNDKVLNEIANYRRVKNVHELPDSFHYVSNRFLKKLLEEKLGISSFAEMVVNHIKFQSSIKNEEEIEVLSLGSGNCDFEIDLVHNYDLKCKVTCYEINPFMLKRAQDMVKLKGLSDQFLFIETDINRMRINRNYDVILANHSLHHFIQLEHIFEQVDECMGEHSFFLINDMIGRNGHMFWDNTLDLCNRIWAILPKELKYNHQLKKYFPIREQWDCSVDGFEGIRAQDILPMADLKFRFKDFGTFFSVTNRFVDRDFGHNFDTSNEFHRMILDLIWYYDDYCLKNRLLKPTQIMASMVKKSVEVSDYKYTYFKNPSDIYNMDDSIFYNEFDKCDSQNTTVLNNAKTSLAGTIKELVSSRPSLSATLKDLISTESSPTGPVKEVIIDYSLEGFKHYGFYNIDDGFRFSDGRGVINLSTILRGKKIRIYLNYFTPEDYDINFNTSILLNDEVTPTEISNPEEPEFCVRFDFKTEEIVNVNKLTIISNSFIPNEINPESQDIRRLGIAFKKLKIVLED